MNAVGSSNIVHCQSVALLVGQFFTADIPSYGSMDLSSFVVKNVDTGGVKLAAAIETMFIKAVFRNMG